MRVRLQLNIDALSAPKRIVSRFKPWRKIQVFERGWCRKAASDGTALSRLHKGNFPYKYMAFSKVILYTFRMKEQRASFEWNDQKQELNLQKHGVSFHEAQLAFLDCYRVIA